jgi:hypothetical protein
VDTLLQQRALAQGTADVTIQRMSPNEILATARLVSNNFRALTNQLGNDLAVKEMEKTHIKCDEKQNERAGCSRKKYPSSVAFTVDMTSKDRTNPVKPKIASKQQQKKKSVLTAEALEEKQRQAEARRNVSIKNHYYYY